MEKLGAEIFPPVNSDSISISGSESVLCKSDVLDFEAEPRAAVVKYPGDGLFLDSSDEQKAISSAGGVRGINFSPEMQVAMRLPEQSAVAHAVSGGDSALAEAIRREGGARRVDILPAARGGMLSEEQAALAFSHIGGVSTASSTRLPPSSSSVLGKLKSAPQYLSPHNVAVEGKDVLWVNFAVHEACSETGAVFDQSTEKNKVCLVAFHVAALVLPVFMLLCL